MPVDVSDWGRAAAQRKASQAILISQLQQLPMAAAQRTADDARSRVSRHPSWRGLDATIQASRVGPMSADVGYVRRGIGRLAHIAERGSARKVPHPAMIPASDAGEQWYYDQAERIVRALL